MTTEKQPAEHEQPAETNPTDLAVPADERPPAADPTPALSGTETAPLTDAPAAADPPVGDAETEAAATPRASEESPAASAASQPAAPQRRVRLNPTVAPDVARPIPSLRSSDPPPPVPAAPTPPDSTVAEPPAEPPAETPTSRSDTAETDEAAAPAAAPPPPPPAAPTPVALPGKGESLDADLEAELEAAMAGNEPQSAPVAETVAASEATSEATEEAKQASQVPLSPDAEIKRGMKLTGTVASIHGDDMFLDFGLRVPGVLSRRQFGLRKQPMQGESLEVVVGRLDENEGLMHVNLPTGTSRVRGEWDALSVDQNVECMVTGTNKGGLEVSIGALRGFMPASQVELGFVPDLNVYVGQKLKARIAEVNPKRRKLVLSRRSLLEEEREESQKELFETIEPGRQYTGRVRTLKDYGAFVDIGGADGLLHVAQISWSRINHPSEVLKEGEEIQVQVLSVDKDKKKISLGMRQLTQNPWTSAESKYSQGAQVAGKVTRIENFGAFVELDEGVEGLVHISELDHKRVNKVSDVLRVGQEIEVQVLEVDQKRKRVSLSLKALKEKPEDPRDAQESRPIKRQRNVDSLVGGMGEPTGGQLFGDPNKFGQ